MIYSFIHSIILCKNSDVTVLAPECVIDDGFPLSVLALKPSQERGTPEILRE